MAPFDNLPDPNINIDAPALPDDQDWRKVLLRAAEMVRERGLCQHTFGHDGRERCLWGHVMTARDDLGLPGPSGVPDGELTASLIAVQKMDRHAEEQGFSGAIDWNDAPGRTAEDVARAMERAAREPGR